MITSRSGATSTWCSGNPDQSLDAAKQNFKTKCGETWDDQKGHVCDYKSDGYHCNGNRSAAASPATSDPSSSTAADTGWCSGTPDRNIDTAKEKFNTGCGQTWNDQLGHVCEWKSDGWHCRGNKSASPAPSAPANVRATRMHPRVVYIEWTSSGAGISYYDLYRNGQKFASTGSSKLLYQDKQARGRPTYQVVAIGKNQVRSPSSSIADPANQLHSRVKNGSSALTRATYTDDNRTVHENGRVTVDVDKEESVIHQSEITDVNGNSLGTVTEVYNGDEVTTTIDATYGDSYSYSNPAPEPVSLQSRLGGPSLDALSAFPPKPTSTPPPGDDGGGGGGGTPTPTTNNCPDDGSRPCS